MPNKRYTLVAWTEDGQVHMIPSLAHEVSGPYRERIEYLESLWRTVEDEVGWLLSKSRAHEEYARFFLRAGLVLEAYHEYEKAAMVCCWCSDSLWLQGVSCDYPTLPLLHRFLSMHARCRELVRKHPDLLKPFYEGSEVEHYYRFFTIDDRETDEEIDRGLATVRAWNFGRRN